MTAPLYVLKQVVRALYLCDPKGAEMIKQKRWQNNNNILEGIMVLIQVANQ
jgi:hypothetical protein